MGTAPAFASVSEAMDMARAALGYLAATDATALAAATQAECLVGLEQTDAISTAVRASFLSAFTAGQGYSADADYSPRAWLIHHTRVTKGVAAAHTAWAQRTVTHPQVVAALAAGDLSESHGRTICQWTDKLPQDCRPAADAILLSAASAGMDLRDLAGLAAEMYQRSRPDEEPDRTFEDRAVRLETTFGGAGVMSGDLTPECAAVVGAVLDALGAPAGAEDTRSHAQRYHDALLEAMRRLLAAGLLPGRAGQPVRALVHVSLADLMLIEGSSALLEQWSAGVRAQWAAARAAASVTGSDGAAWLDGDDRGGVHLRRLGHPGGHRGRQPGRAGGPDPAVHRARPAPPRCRRDRPGRRRRRTRHSGPGRRWRPGHYPGPGRADPGGHRRGGGAAVRPGRPGQLPAPPAARRAAGRAEPAAGCRGVPGHPGRGPPRGDPAGPALPVPRRLRPARGRAARCTTSATRPTAGRPASPAAPCSASTTTRSSSTSRAGPWS